MAGTRKGKGNWAGIRCERGARADCVHMLTKQPAHRPWA